MQSRKIIAASVAGLAALLASSSAVYATVAGVAYRGTSDELQAVSVTLADRSASEQDPVSGLDASSAQPTSTTVERRRVSVATTPTTAALITALAAASPTTVTTRPEVDDRGVHALGNDVSDDWGGVRAPGVSDDPANHDANDDRLGDDAADRAGHESGEDRRGSTSGSPSTSAPATTTTTSKPSTPTTATTVEDRGGRGRSGQGSGHR